MYSVCAPIVLGCESLKGARVTKNSTNKKEIACLTILENLIKTRHATIIYKEIFILNNQIIKRHRFLFIKNIITKKKLFFKFFLFIYYF